VPVFRSAMCVFRDTVCTFLSPKQTRAHTHTHTHKIYVYISSHMFTSRIQKNKQTSMTGGWHFLDLLNKHYCALDQRFATDEGVGD
jgi:hypothetical protein